MEIDLKRILFSLVRNIWLILLVGLVVGSLTFGYAKFSMDKKYAAEVRMYVNNTYGAGTVGFSSSQMSAAQSLAYTYMVILDSYDVLDDVSKVAVESYGASRYYSVSELRGMIASAAIDETEVIRVVVTSTNRHDAEKIANAVKDVLPATVNSIVSVESADGSAAAPLVSLQKAENRGKVAPNEKKYATLGFAVGVILSVAFVIAKDVLDTSINSEEFLADVYEEIPLLAVIPDAENPKSSSGYKGTYEAYRKKPAADKKGGAKR